MRLRAGGGFGAEAAARPPAAGPARPASPRPRPATPLGHRRRQGRRRAFRGGPSRAVQQHIGSAGEDDRVALIDDPKSLRLYVARGAMPRNRVVAFRRVLSGVDPRRRGDKARAVLVRHRHIAEQVDHAGLRLIDRADRGGARLVAPLRSLISAPGPAATSDPGDRESAVRSRRSRQTACPRGLVPIARVDHAQLPRVAQIDRREADPHPLP